MHISKSELRERQGATPLQPIFQLYVFDLFEDDRCGFVALVARNLFQCSAHSFIPTSSTIIDSVCGLSSDLVLILGCKYLLG